MREEWRAMVWRTSWDAPSQFATRGPASCITESLDRRRKLGANGKSVTWIEGEASAFRLPRPAMRRVLDALREFSAARSALASTGSNLSAALKGLVGTEDQA